MHLLLCLQNLFYNSTAYRTVLVFMEHNSGLLPGPDLEHDLYVYGVSSLLGLQLALR